MMLEWHGVLAGSEVIGTDILEESLEDAARGISGGARIPAALRDRVKWDLRDLTTGGTPGGAFDIVLCRNLLSYLTPAAADVVARSLAGSLEVGGVLLVAREERIENSAALGLSEIATSAYKRVS